MPRHRPGLLMAPVGRSHVFFERRVIRLRATLARTWPQVEISDCHPRRERARRVKTSSIPEGTQSRRVARTHFHLRNEGLKSLATFPTRSSRNSPDGAAPCQPGPDGTQATVGLGTGEKTRWRPERPGQPWSRPCRPPPRGRPDFPGRRSLLFPERSMPPFS